MSRNLFLSAKVRLCSAKKSKILHYCDMILLIGEGCHIFLSKGLRSEKGKLRTESAVSKSIKLSVEWACFFLYPKRLCSLNFLGFTGRNYYDAPFLNNNPVGLICKSPTYCA